MPQIKASADEQHLKPYEAAARIYCAKVNMNPDFSVDVPHPPLVDVTIATPFWVMVAEKMVDLSQMLTSIKEAAAQREAACGTQVKEH